tara:strand:- start:1191 stop:2552 length:1362 start_codon:yes stop_codon:yes gene_type:complete
MTKNTSRIFYLFLLVHLTIWTLVPFLTNKNLPLDTIEHLAWGSNLDWGFSKHPPMVAFVLEFFHQIFGSQDWAFYLLSQIFVITAFFIVYKFSEDFFKDKNYPLLSVLLLEGIYFYNFTTPEFNVNVCQLPFWALSVFYAWKGFKDNKILDWLLFGLFAGLGVLSKYLFIYLLIGMDVFLFYMIIKKKINFKVLISLIPFFLVLSPHIIWLIDNNYVTITYALNRTVDPENLFDHLTNPIIFLVKQFGILVPFFLLFLLLAKKIQPKINLKDKKLLFLLATNIVPILLLLLTSMIMGTKIRTMWMTPFYLFFGTLLIYVFQSKINLKSFKKFYTAFVFLFAFSPLLYAYISITETNKRTDYPGKEIARLVQNRWDKNFSNKIRIVVGDEWSGGNLSYHLSSRPKWLNKLGKNLDYLGKDEGVIYTGNPKVLKEICPGVFGTIKPIGICMIGSR